MRLTNYVGKRVEVTLMNGTVITGKLEKGSEFLPYTITDEKTGRTHRFHRVHVKNIKEMKK